MSLFRFLWLRRYIRKNTTPIRLTTAETWKKRLSVMYMLLCWNAFGFVCYMCYVGKADWAKFHGLKSEAEAKMPAGQVWAQTLGIDKVKVIRVSGLSPQGSYEVEGGEIVEKPEKETT